jgi:purine-binding chemotaxis protein CheW
MDKNVVVEETKQYIVAKLDIEQFGIDIGYIDNIVRMQKITRIPKSQRYFKGVINLRGEVIPVMSLRLKFDLDDDVITNASRIIIIKLENSGMVGLIVDEVKEVVTLSSSEVEKPKASKDSKNNEMQRFLAGIGKHGDTLISLLNINNVVMDKEN